MAEKLRIEDAAYSYFIPINRRFAPTIEQLRAISLQALFDNKTAPNSSAFIKARFGGDTVGVQDGVEPDLTEQGLVIFRIFDLINKTELKCFFINSLQWFTEYPTDGTKRLNFVFNLFNSFRTKIELRSKPELLALGVPEPTIDTVISYLNTDDPVNFVSAVCSIILLACLTSAGNRALDRTPV